MPADQPPASSQGLFSDDYLKAPDTLYQIETEYFTDEGVIGAPVAGPPGTPMRAIRVSAPYGYRVVNWIAQRLGEKPILPAPDPPDGNQVLKHKRIIPQSPAVLSDSLAYLYTVKGSYYYLLLKPLDENSDLPFGAPPTFKTPLANNKLTAADFRKGIIQ